MKLRAVGWPLAAAALAVAASPLGAAPLDMVKARVAGFRDIGTAYKIINDELRGKNPDMMLVRLSGRELAKLSREIEHWFPQGSGPQPGVKTLALPTIWTQRTKFNAARVTFVNQAAALQKAIDGTDVAAMKVEARKLGATCKGCHDQFKDHRD
jgi:cytochrome c556